MIRRAVLAVVSALVLAAPVLAQEAVGSALVDGRKVELFSDFTWRYEVPPEASCVTLSKTLQFCGLGTWTIAAKANPDAVAAYRADDRHYGQFVIETVGLRDGLTMEAIRGAVLQMASAQVGAPVTFVETASVTVDGIESETLVYVVPFGGIDNVFANTLVLGEDFLLQVQTWQFGPLPYSDRHRDLHANFLEATRITAGN